MLQSYNMNWLRFFDLVCEMFARQKLAMFAIRKIKCLHVKEEAEIEAQAQIEQESSQNRNVAIPNPNFVDPGCETENEYNKTHEMTRDEVRYKFNGENIGDNGLINCISVQSSSTLCPKSCPSTKASSRLRQERPLDAQQTQAYC